MNLYLREPKRKDETTIIIQYRFDKGRQTFKYSTSEKVLPENWNFDAKSVKSKKGALGVALKKIQLKIMIYQDFLNDTIHNAKVKNIHITKEYLKKEFDNKFKLKPELEEKKMFSFQISLLNL